MDFSPDEATEAKRNVIASIVKAAQFLPYSKEDLIEYINEHGFDVTEISSEVLYKCDSALISEGVIDECVVKVANYLGIKNLDNDFMLVNRDSIIDELICLTRDVWGQEDTFLNTYEEPINYIIGWVDTCLREYLTENPEEIGLNEDEDEYSDKIEEWLTNINERILEQFYQEVEAKLFSTREENYQQ